jgi:hypothetical protein
MLSGNNNVNAFAKACHCILQQTFLWKFLNVLLSTLVYAYVYR